MWIVCITSVRHVLTVNGYGGRQTKENEKSWCFKGWETLVKEHKTKVYISKKLGVNRQTLREFLKTHPEIPRKWKRIQKD